MTHLVEFTTDDGGTVVVEVASTAGSLVTRGGDHAGDHSGIFARAQQTFERALAHVRPAVQGVIDELLSLDNRPDEVSVEFGIDLHAEAGAFIASASTASNFKVTLTWNKPTEPSAPPIAG
ncbi:CU044_2847 family protein [Paenarthrobacter sp. NPDC092416]|uniref:CU044_2847 family protein n=1 Tax=Paenarthrobacter sp. NPDC092416 TaxID=3364386 RepID=UPI00382743C1